MNRIVRFGNLCADWLTVLLIVLIPVSLIGAPMAIAMSNGWSFFPALLCAIAFYAILLAPFLLILFVLAVIGAIFDYMPKGKTFWFFWWG